MLARWIAEVASRDDSCLDIGAGDGDDTYFRLIRPLVGTLVGVDPDPRALGHSGLDELHQASIETFAARFVAVSPGAARANVVPEATALDPPRSSPDHSSQLFDLALAIYVVEHVSEPAAFFRAARSCLRPGGSLFLITPNLWHYFGALAKATEALGVEDRLLGALRATHPDHNEVAHFPVAYRANSVRALRKIGNDVGFSALEIRHLDNPAVFETYFPGRSATLPRLYSQMVHRIGRVELFGTLICRFVN